jgi:hypothetical protein
LTQRLLDPVERTSEILFGIIMVLTFTSSISVAESGREGTREILVGALACNFAWGLVDAVMFLMSRFIERARNVATLRAAFLHWCRPHFRLARSNPCANACASRVRHTGVSV